MLEISLEKIPRAKQHDYAHAMLSKQLAELDIDCVSAVICRNSHGKPFLQDYPDIHFNLSHADGITACYVGRYEAGIDAEKIRPYRDGVLKRAFSDAERLLIEKTSDKDLMFFRLWTLKESFVKALGIGVSYPLKTAEFGFDGERIVTDIKGYRFRQYIIAGRYVVSLCRKEA